MVTLALIEDEGKQTATASSMVDANVRLRLEPL